MNEKKKRVILRLNAKNKAEAKSALTMALTKVEENNLLILAIEIEAEGRADKAYRGDI